MNKPDHTKLATLRAENARLREELSMHEHGIKRRLDQLCAERNLAREERDAAIARADEATSELERAKNHVAEFHGGLPNDDALEGVQEMEKLLIAQRAASAKEAYWEGFSDGYGSAQYDEQGPDVYWQQSAIRASLGKEGA